MSRFFYGLSLSKIRDLAYILHIETSTKNCSVSIAADGKVLSLKEINNGNYSHAEMLHPLILDSLKESNIKISDIDAVAVGKGPGSYTGLRIGVSAAKGLCFANNLPLLSINSLEILAHTQQIEKEGYLVPMIDARRMEVYAAIYNTNYESIRDTQADIVTDKSYLEYLEKGDVYFFGDGAEKCKETITHKNAHFVEGQFPSAEQMALLSYEKYLQKDFEDVAYFEPFYLKDFIVTSEKKKI